MSRDVQRRKYILGRVLRAAREARGWSQIELGLRAAIHHNYISSGELGERNISFVALDRWIRALGLRWHTFGERLDTEFQTEFGDSDIESAGMKKQKRQARRQSLRNVSS